MGYVSHSYPISHIPYQPCNTRVPEVQPQPLEGSSNPNLSKSVQIPTIRNQFDLQSCGGVRAGIFATHSFLVQLVRCIPAFWRRCHVNSRLVSADLIYAITVGLALLLQRANLPFSLCGSSRPPPLEAHIARICVNCDLLRCRAAVACPCA